MNSLFFRDLELIKRDERQYTAYRSMANSVIIAGPGSGKTRVLTLKAVTLAKSHIHKPCGLACISYSRESVRELKKRFKSYGYVPTHKDFIGTVHSFSLLHVIQPFAHLYPQYNVTYPIKILPDEVKTGLYNSVLHELKIEDGRTLTLTDINKHRSLSIRGRSEVNMESSPLVAKGAELFEKKLSETEFIDFVSIINLSAKIINEQDYVRETLRSQFPWLLVDEYQDLGKALHEMVLELVFNADIKLYAVGDTNQSIYGFNGGYPDFLEELTTNDNIKTIELISNYRSSQHIINASREALQPTPPYPEYVSGNRQDDVADFTFITCQEEMEPQFQIVANKVVPNLLAKNIPLNEIGIIASSREQIHQMAHYLQREGIPFFIVNWNFENSEVVVWLQECALWCNDPESQSFDELFKTWKRKLIEVHLDPRENWEDIRLKKLFYKVLNESLSKSNCYGWLRHIIDNLGLKKTLTGSEIYPNEVNNLEKLLEEAKLHNLKDTTIKRFAHLGFPENQVTITTRHSSKGLEFETVILLGMEEERFPDFRHLNNPIALAEDQRLCYVCISRAKKSCILLRSKIYNIPTRRGNWEKVFAPSRFWVSLHNMFGNEQNTFTENNYPLLPGN
ncbi:ATP-dependent helicase [Chryseobacterium arthrosphaerae]|uniref:UvrD-helicase domain-containing protein n=1 Tax=Chryseobacterium arthrosphaerae TaxID=651561 RepID=UPI000F4E2FFB|nr:ATP-dependent helicase [Chryseobacterium arthrosphaerae]AYZ11536.1 ATP-dependent helicase [Chryseobacterium arthrosphaerae]